MLILKRKEFSNKEQKTLRNAFDLAVARAHLGKGEVNKMLATEEKDMFGNIVKHLPKQIGRKYSKDTRRGNFDINRVVNENAVLSRNKNDQSYPFIFNPTEEFKGISKLLQNKKRK